MTTGQAINSPKQVLIAARKRLEDRDVWGGPPSARGPECAQVAIAHSCMDREVRAETYKTFCVANSLRAFSELPMVSIWNWNDDEKRTHAEVLAAFDKAIEAAP